MSEEGSMKFTADDARCLAYKSDKMKDKEALIFLDRFLDDIRRDAATGGRCIRVAVPEYLVIAGQLTKIMVDLRELGFEVSSEVGGRYNEIEHYLSISW